jgi:hypothetical protein
VEPKPPRDVLLDEWDEVEEREALEGLEPELNQERDEDDDEPLAELRRTASIAFGLGRGRPSVRLGPKYDGP